MYRIILVPVDGSPAASAGLTEAIRIAAAVGSRLHLMNVVDDLFEGDDDPAGEGLHDLVRERGLKVLELARRQAAEHEVAASTALVKSGAAKLTSLLANEAARCSADLIVLGTHGHRGLSRLLMGTESEHLLNVTTVPVLLVRSDEVGPDVSVVEFSATDSMSSPGT
ncbi:MAG TPA: universal stress protein [Caldimonas sp.]|nr:universal stress protein [Caldimonas sp.]